VPHHEKKLTSEFTFHSLWLLERPQHNALLELNRAISLFSFFLLFTHSGGRGLSLGSGMARLRAARDLGWAG